MTLTPRSDTDKYLLAVPLLMALVLGGGTRAGLITDTVTQLVAVLASSIVIMRNMDRPIDRRAFWFLVCVTGGFVLQLLPISSELTRSTQGILPDVPPDVLTDFEGRTLSLDVSRTMEVAVYFLTLSFFFAAVTKLRVDQVFSLIPFFLVGVVINLAAGSIQYSFSGQASVRGLFPYDLNAGFFVNTNHFSSLIFISIPIAFAYFLKINRPLLLIAYVMCALLILLAAGSLAGVLIGFAIAALSVVTLLQRHHIGILLVISGAALAGVYGVAVWTRIRSEQFHLGFGRWEFARTTWEGIRDNFPFGIGYGNFVTGYPSYEKSSMIFHRYVNHAHNDYLELLFEGGVFAAAALFAFFVILFWRTLETLSSPLHRATALAVIFVLVHSVADYPLRTLAIGFSFTLFLGLLFHRGPERPGKPPAGEARLEVDGKVVVVPLTGSN